LHTGVIWYFEPLKIDLRSQYTMGSKYHMTPVQGQSIIYFFLPRNLL